ncbi:hypothetical protein C5167_037960 [Papaver somniferum]|uniref:F-box/LRR-repeat protein 15-like leucin rich repeat domain-containing protein n=1 Tax=Papaver somniferum TaxID=3469 RepID=A0A4Y7I877_PAPSO|nr:hypothetical protein C5167_037960 [Papaver somniferum]
MEMTKSTAPEGQTLEYLPSDIAPPMKQLTPLLPTNPYLKSIRVDCKRLDDKAIDCLLKPSLEELYLYNCEDFSGKLLSRIGFQCSNLKFVS